MATVASDIQCLHELFEAQADLRPEAPAIVCGERTYSYEEVERRANQLARHLRALGVGPGSLVGIHCQRSARPIIAVLACLKAGAAYVPLDPEYPAQRMRHILDQAESRVVLTEQALSAKVSGVFDGRVVLLDAEAETIARQSDERIPRGESGVAPGDLCYVIFTSGTTGRPKGVMTEHRNAVRFVGAFNDVCGMDHSDRIYQGFSLAFDGSVEEIWMAFSNGAALVVGSGEVVRFGSEVAKLLNRRQVTYLSTVPTFLSMIDEDLPTVRLLVVSAEPCPPELVAKWAKPSRRMLNVYGPTEATVNSTAAECLPERPVTIGRPLPDYETFVLDENLQPVPPGTPGELFVGGVGVARGYFKQPELTAKQFIPNPLNHGSRSTRLYRTGDLVRQNEEGELEFLGRIDSQVKVRGYRVELSEIESVLREHPRIRAAAVKVVDRDGAQDLAGYVVPKEQADGFDQDGVYELLQARLPAYMIPAYLDALTQLPTLTSGKIDRKSLPEPTTPLARTRREAVGPRTDVERRMVEVWEELFNVSPVSIDDDFFLDLGGYSLLAAQAVSRLRVKSNLEVAIRDIYEHATIRELAECLAERIEREAAEASASADSPEGRTDRRTSPRKSARQVFQSQWTVTRWCCVAMQAVSLLLIYGFVTMPLVLVSGVVFAVLRNNLPVEPAVMLVSALTFGAFPMMLLASVAVKWLVIGRYKPGRHPLWGAYYFRWWLATRFQALSGIGILAGTPVMSLYYRLLGAKVGRNCILDTALCGAFDLISIGDDTCIGSETQLLGYRVEDGMLILGTVEIGSRCFVGIHSNLGLNSRMEDDSRLDDLSLLADGCVIPAGQSRRGSPAQAAKVDLPEVSEARAARRHPFLFGLIHILIVAALEMALLVTTVPAALIVAFPMYLGGPLWGALAVLVAVPVEVTWYCLCVAALKALILGRMKPGVLHVESVLYLRKWTVDVLISTSRAFLHPLYTTIYLPTWLRLLGAKIGVRAEISTVTQVTPDLIVIEDESFFADGSMVGGRHYYRGHAQFAANRIGRRSFVGNNAILPLGSALGENCLLGVLSAPPAGCERTPDGTEWLGSPSFRLPHRKKVEGFRDAETFRPTVWLYFLRFVIDGLRILIPYYILAAAGMAFVALMSLSYAGLPLWATLVFTPPVALGLAVGAALSVVVLKRLLMAPFKPVIKPLWCTYIWWNEVINGAYETVATPALAPLLGTPFINGFLRLMGCKIGRHVYMESPLFSEFDLVDIGDHAAINLGAVVQNHLFEDRIMKSSYLRVGDECTVGNMAVVLYDTEMKQGACVGPLSLLMKGETLPASTRWLGIPTRAVAETEG